MKTERDMRMDQTRAALQKTYDNVNKGDLNAAIDTLETARLILLSTALLDERDEMRAEMARAELKEMGSCT